MYCKAFIHFIKCYCLHYRKTLQNSRLKADSIYIDIYNMYRNIRFNFPMKVVEGYRSWREIELCEGQLGSILLMEHGDRV